MPFVGLYGRFFHFYISINFWVLLLCFITRQPFTIMEIQHAVIEDLKGVINTNLDHIICKDNFPERTWANLETKYINCHLSLRRLNFHHSSLELYVKLDVFYSFIKVMTHSSFHFCQSSHPAAKECKSGLFIEMNLKICIIKHSALLVSYCHWQQLNN